MILKIKRLINKVLKLIINSRLLSVEKYPITVLPKSQKIKGRVLFSYLPQALGLEEDNKIFDGHSNTWESREIANIFLDLGFAVHAFPWNDYNYIPDGDYDVIFDIFINLPRALPYINKDVIKILHMTGSYAPYQNKAEFLRAENLEKRRKCHYTPKRIVPYVELNEQAIQKADACSLIGSRHTLSTYPKKYWNKINLITVSASKLAYYKNENEYVPGQKEFLWFFGSGAVHKGLDLLLEVFSRNTKYVLNIIGPTIEEKDFFKIYKYELTKLKNIKYQGALNPNSTQFNKILRNSFCFISPSCSEGISPAAVTCIQAGLFPIISRDTGIDLPSGCGIYLNRCSIDEIEKSIVTAYSMKNSRLAEQIKRCQNYALKQYSREKFSEDMRAFIEKTLKTKGLI